MKNVVLDCDKNITCIAAHNDAFQIENLFPLELFTNLVQKADDCTIECSCKIEGEKLYPARFNLWFHNNRRVEQISAVLDFFRTVETQAGVQLDYELFQEFYDDRFDWSKVKKLITGVDLREELSASRLKIWFIIEGYPEKLETAIRLHGESEDLRSLIVHDELLLGFDFYLDGRSGIKVYPDIKQDEFQQADVQQRLKRALSLPALQLLEACWWLHVSFAKEGQDKILHYHPFNPNSFIEQYLGNEMARQIHNHYRKKRVLDMVISLRERELLEGSIQNLNLYYMQ